MGQEAGGGRRGSPPRPTSVESNPHYPPQEHLILEWSGLERCSGEVAPVPCKWAGVDTSLVPCVAGTPAPGLGPWPPKPGFALWGRKHLPRFCSLCLLALPHIPVGPDLLADEARSLCSGMWGNQSLECGTGGAGPYPAVVCVWSLPLSYLAWSEMPSTGCDNPSPNLGTTPTPEFCLRQIPIRLHLSARHYPGHWAYSPSPGPLSRPGQAEVGL